MRVTIGICTWNRARYLAKTLEQMTTLAIPAGVEWELLVVNNNCTDDTDAVIAAYSGRLPVRRLSEPVPGLAHARNLVVREASGDIIVWTDDDAIVASTWIEVIVRTFEEHNADWVFGRSFPMWEAQPPAWYSHRFDGYFALLDYGPNAFVVSDLDHPFYGLNNACRRAAVVALGPYRQEFGLAGNVGGVGEDMDMFGRALHAGNRIVYAPDAVVQHIIPASRTTTTLQRRKAWIGSEAYLQLLSERAKGEPWLLGIPRYFFRFAISDLAAYRRAAVTGDKSEAFYHELRLIRFAGLLYEAAWRRSAGAARAVEGLSPKPR